MLKVKPDGQGRRNVVEIIEEVWKKYSVFLVGGTKQVLQTDNAFNVKGQVASFLDARCSYYIHQDGKSQIVWETDPLPKFKNIKEVVFIFSMGLGNGSVLPQPSGKFEFYLNDEYLLSFAVTKENRTWRREGISFHFEVKRFEYASSYIPLMLDSHIREESFASFGLGLLKVAYNHQRFKAGKRAIFKVLPRNRQSSRRWFKLDLIKGEELISKSDLEQSLETVCGPKTYPEMGKYKFFFGDIHAHSGEGEKSCGIGTLEENYHYAKKVACLDVFGLTEHDWQIEDWNLWLRKADDHNRNGCFVTIPSFEWTSPIYGHRNVYYKDSQWPFFKSEDSSRGDKYQTPAQLWKCLRYCKAEAITVPHHPNTGSFPVDWSYNDPEYERLVEIYSSWGNSEYYNAPYAGQASDRHKGFSVQDALKLGYRLGFIASSDGHDGNPGNAQWSNKQPHIKHLLGSGLVAIIARELNRDSIFEALYNRRCYATTGARIVLDFRVNGEPMGREIVQKKKKDRCLIEAFVSGPVKLSKLEILWNNKVIYTHLCESFQEKVSLEDNNFLANDMSYYYLRIQQMDGEMAWSSPIWILK